MLDLVRQLESVMPTELTGSVARTVGMTVSVADFPAPVGALAEIQRQTGPPLAAEVIGFRDELTVLYPFRELAGVRHGNRVRLVRTSRWLRVGDELLGRVIDSQGRVVDGKPEPALEHRTRFQGQPPHPCDRPRIEAPLTTGVRSIDGLLTCGKGQRMGIFSGAGVGKSVLLGMMARNTDAEVIVICLVGERGREVNEFIQRDLGPEGLAKSVVVVATSNEPALVRAHAASTATAVAEYFRDQGKNVLLLMDSLTRFALAQREIGLAAGEPPTTRGHPPSVFALLPQLVERTGRSPRGSITAFYAVLVEADDPNEPISDAVRGLLDGHIWLSRKLASRGHYPAVDVLESLSRLMPEVTDEPHRQATVVLRRLLSAHRDHEDLISIGAYRQGSNPAVDVGVEMQERIGGYLCQPVDERSTADQTRAALLELKQEAEKRLAGASSNAAQNAPSANAAPSAARAKAGAAKKASPARRQARKPSPAT